MRKDKLLKLADFLETVPDHAFDIALWQAQKPTKKEGKVPGHCGFAGCAVGWAAHEQMFRGLRFGKGKREDQGEVYYQYAKNAAKIEGWAAVERIFEISHADAKRLFSAQFYSERYSVSQKTVADSIRKFVASNGAFP